MVLLYDLVSTHVLVCGASSGCLDGGHMLGTRIISGRSALHNLLHSLKLFYIARVSAYTDHGCDTLGDHLLRCIASRRELLQVLTALRT